MPAFEALKGDSGLECHSDTEQESEKEEPLEEDPSGHRMATHRCPHALMTEAFDLSVRYVKSYKVVRYVTGRETKPSAKESACQDTSLSSDHFRCACTDSLSRRAGNCR